MKKIVLTTMESLIFSHIIHEKNLTVPDLEHKIYGYNIRRTYGKNGGSSYVRKSLLKMAENGILKTTAYYTIVNPRSGHLCFGSNISKRVSNVTFAVSRKQK